MTGRPPLFSIALLSAVLLAYEILLIHLFAIIQYHHFASIWIGLALLGYGASGTFLTFAQRWLQEHYRACYIAAIIFFSCSALGGFLLAQRVAFNGQELFWDLRQIVAVVQLSTLLLIPFFFGGLAIGLTLMVYRQATSAVYGADLMGAGVGSLLVIILLFLLFPLMLLVTVCGLGMCCAIVALFELKVSRPIVKSLMVAGVFAVVAGVGLLQDLRPTPYKSIEQYLRREGARITVARSSPLGLVQVMESPVIPFRYAPGMSLVSEDEPPAQKGVFINGEGLSVIVRNTGDRQQLAYLDQMTSALPYHLRQLNDVAILGAGGGADILQARYHRVPHITAVELNGQLVELLKTIYADYSGNVLGGETKVQIADIRGFMAKSRDSFDLVNLALVDTYLPAAAGLYGLQANYLFTVEAMQAYLDHLRPDGFLAITRWIRIPPRDGLKLAATAVTALKNRNIEKPGRHLVLIRGWQTSTLLVKRSPFTAEEISRVEYFCTDRSFDIGYSFAITKDEVNRYNVLREPVFYEGITALVGDGAQKFLQRYKYNLEPATDNRPYFHHFFKWSALPEILRLRSAGGAALMETGYLVLLTVFGVVMLLSFLLILSPLILFSRRTLITRGVVSRRRVLLYFLLIGVAFLFIEIAFIQKFILYLHHPVYAASVCVSAFLVFGGCGSLISQRLAGLFSPEAVLQGAVCAIVVLSLGYLFFLKGYLALVADLPFWGRALISSILICPLAVCMGMPFPLALSSLKTYGRELIPWAWGINGCSSVISSMGATLLAIGLGQRAVIVAALVLYLGILVCFPFPKKDVRAG